MLKQFIKEVSTIWASEQPNQLAAALAYYSIFSFAPIIFVTISIVSFFIKEIDPSNQLYQHLKEVFGSAISELVQESVAALSTTPSSSSWLISVISFLALLYAASGLFYQLQFSLNTIWRVPPPEKGHTFGFLRKRLFSFLAVIGLGLVAVLATFADILLTTIGSIMQELLGLAGEQMLAVRLAVPVLLVLIIALFYKILPETRIAWRDVWLGATITTVLIVMAMLLAGFYFQFSNMNSALQATGAFTVLLVSFNYLALIFLFGAVCCRVYADLYGSKRSEIN